MSPNTPVPLKHKGGVEVGEKVVGWLIGELVVGVFVGSSVKNGDGVGTKRVDGTNVSGVGPGVDG